MEVTPAILAAAMENGVSALPGGGRFPQISGFSFTFAPYAEEGYRVQSISVDGVELDLTDDTTIFTLATNNFIAAGGDAYTMFTDLEVLMELGNQDEIVIDFINYMDLACLEVEGRIVAVYVAVVAPILELDEYVVLVGEYEYAYEYVVIVYEAYEYEDEYYIVVAADEYDIIVVVFDDEYEAYEEYEPIVVVTYEPAARVNPQTGDTTAVVSMMAIIVMAGSAMVFGVAGLVKRKRR